MNIEEFAIKYLGYTIQPWQRPWIDFLEGIKYRGLLLAPRGHGKTTTVNYIWLSWVIANNPDLRILLISHSKDMAEKFSMAVRNVMESKELQAQFDFEDDTPWRANSWRLNRSPQSKPTLECKGAMGRMTGWRGDMVIFDDLLEFSTESESTRLKLENWRNQSVIPAIDTHKLDKVVVVGTRKSIDDWYGQLLTGSLYESHVDRAFQSEDYKTNPAVECLAPFLYDTLGNTIPFWNRDALLRRREEIGALKFEQEYQNRPSPKGGLDFSMDWPRYYEHLPHVELTYYMGIDPASESQDSSSYFAMCVVAHDAYANDIYVVDLYRGKDTKREQVQKAMLLATKYAPAAIYIEAVFQYTHIYDAMVRQFPNVHNKDYIHTQLKGVSAKAKEARIAEVVGPAFEMRRVYLKRPELDPFTKKFIDHEYRPFPVGDKDMLDAMVLAIHSLVKQTMIRHGEVPWVGFD